MLGYATATKRGGCENDLVLVASVVWVTYGYITKRTHNLCDPFWFMYNVELGLPQNVQQIATYCTHIWYHESRYILHDIPHMAMLSLVVTGRKKNPIEGFSYGCKRCLQDTRNKCRIVVAYDATISGRDKQRRPR